MLHLNENSNDKRKFALIGLVGQFIITIGFLSLFFFINNHLRSIPISVKTSTLGVLNYNLHIKLENRFLPDKNLSSFQPHLFDKSGESYPISYTVSSNESSVFLSLPLSLNANSKKRFFIEWLPAKKQIDLPQYHERTFSKQTGTSGVNITSWKIESISKLKNVIPFEGKKMLHLQLKAIPNHDDHFTNFSILLHPFNKIRINKNTKLQYSLYYPQKSTLRVTVQALFTENPPYESTAFEEIPDQNGFPCTWNTDLSNETGKQWYERIISLEKFSGKQLYGLALFTNDDPTSSNYECSKLINVFVDNINVFDGEIPDVYISNPIREFLRAVNSSPFFIFVLISLFFWLLLLLLAI